MTYLVYATKVSGSMMVLQGLLAAYAVLSGFGARVHGVLTVAREAREMYEAFGAEERIRDGPKLSVTDLTCVTPSGKVLYDAMSFRVESGRSLLIEGPSGSGKSGGRASERKQNLSGYRRGLPFE